MFKKSMAALAVLSLSAGLASASEVTLYGIVDNGLLYKHSKVETNGVSTKTDSFGLESGISSPSRFGIKGSEELGNGMTVSFKLENGFNADDGSFGDDRLFNRESSLTLSGDFGKLSFGRMGAIGSAAGDFDAAFGIGDAFDGGDGDVFGMAASDRYDNMVTYQTPKFAGLQATVQYSFNEDSVEETAREGSSAVNRYSSAALTGDFGALQTVLAYEFQNYKSFGAAEHDDGQIVYLGGNYDCGFAKTFVMGQYFKGIQGSGANALASMVKGAELKTFDTDFDKGVKGFGAHLGTIVPISNGDLTVGAYYVDGTAETSKTGVEERDFDYMGLATKYEYRLSKRTSVYLAAGYYKATLDATTKAGEVEEKVGEVFTGLTHAF